MLHSGQIICQYDVPMDIFDVIRKQLNDDENARADNCLISRYYIARKSEINPTVESIRKYLKWRKQIDSKIILPSEGEPPLLVSIRGIDGIPNANYNCSAEGVPESIKKFWMYTGGVVIHKTDRNGSPILIDRLGRYDVKNFVNNADMDSVCRWHISVMEFMIKRVFKANERKFGVPVNKHVSIIDCAGIGLKHLNIAGLRFIKRLSEIDSEYYPERLKKLYIVNTSPVFSKIWSIAKNWIDKDILKNIYVGRNLYDMVDEESIPQENVPAYLGGACTCPESQGGCVPMPSDIVRIMKNNV